MNSGLAAGLLVWGNEEEKKQKKSLERKVQVRRSKTPG